MEEITYQTKFFQWQRGMRLRVYEQDYLVVLSNLNWTIAKKYSVPLEALRYDSILISAYLGEDPPQDYGTHGTKHWEELTDKAKKAASRRAVEIGVGMEDVETLFRDTVVQFVKRNGSYWFENSGDQHVLKYEKTKKLIA